MFALHYSVSYLQCHLRSALNKSVLQSHCGGGKTSEVCAQSLLCLCLCLPHCFTNKHNPECSWKEIDLFMETNWAGILHIALVTVIALCIFLEWSWAFFPRPATAPGPAVSCGFALLTFSFVGSIYCSPNWPGYWVTEDLGTAGEMDAVPEVIRAIPALLPIFATSYTVWSQIIWSIMCCGVRLHTVHHPITQLKE